MNLSIKKALWFLLFLGNGIMLSAQEKAIYTLDGYMGVQGGESFNYNLQLQDSAGVFLKGCSFTYQTPDKAVKTYLVAEVNKEQKTLHIKEQSIVYNHGFKSHAVICLVEALLTYDKDRGVLSGSLITKTIDNGRPCSSGSISFIHKEQIKALFSEKLPAKEIAKPTNKTKSSRPDPNQKLHAYFEQKRRKEMAATKAQTENKSPEIKKANAVAPPEKITAGKNAVYTWKSDKIIFNIWDGGAEDNDRVNVFYNGKEVLSNYTLKNKKKELVLDIGGNELNIISIFAINEGNKSPNTANISIQDGEKIYDILAHNTVGKKAILMIKKQRAKDVLP